MTIKFKQYRKFDSDVHVIEFDPHTYSSQLVFGQKNKLEPLSQIRNNWYDTHGYHEIAKINAGFFYATSSGVNEHLGWSAHDSGFANGIPNVGVESYLTKSNELIIKQVSNSEAESLKTQVKYGGSFSYSLIVDGKENYMGSEHFSHFNERHPRTMWGQKKDKTIVFVVVDGRNTASKIDIGKRNRGINGKEQYEIGKELQCQQFLNLDGGGSSQLNIRTQKGMEIINTPSDGEERDIGSALILYAKEPIVLKGDDNMSSLRLVIDAGHGYNTSGKRTPDGSMREFEFNSVVARYVRDELTKYENVETKFVHDDTGVRDVPLKERTDIANAWKADAYVSIHANAYGTGWNDVQGIETFTYTTALSESKKLANEIHSELIKETGRKDRGVKAANFHVLRETIMPAVLVEAEFMSNKESAELLKTDSYRRKCAKAIVNGIVKTYGLKLKSGQSTPTPTPSTPTKPQSDNTYTVKNGDSLWAISHMHNITVEELKSLNSLTSNVIYTGQVLKVKADTKPEPIPQPKPTPTPKPEPTKPAQDWQTELGIDAANYLASVGLMNNPEAYYDNMREPAEQWLIFELIARLHKELK